MHGKINIESSTSVILRLTRGTVAISHSTSGPHRASGKKAVVTVRAREGV